MESIVEQEFQSVTDTGQIGGNDAEPGGRLGSQPGLGPGDDGRAFGLAVGTACTTCLLRSTGIFGRFSMSMPRAASAAIRSDSSGV